MIDQLFPACFNSFPAFGLVICFFTFFLTFFDIPPLTELAWVCFFAAALRSFCSAASKSATFFVMAAVFLAFFTCFSAIFFPFCTILFNALLACLMIDQLFPACFNSFPAFGLVICFFTFFLTFFDIPPLTELAWVCFFAAALRSFCSAASKSATFFVMAALRFTSAASCLALALLFTSALFFFAAAFAFCSATLFFVSAFIFLRRALYLADMAEA